MKLLMQKSVSRGGVRALADGGFTGWMVCGRRIADRVIERLQAQEKGKSGNLFHFGGGNAISRTTWQAQVQIGAISIRAMLDVVDAVLPLLIGRRFMKAAGAIENHNTGTLEINGMIVGSEMADDDMMWVPLVKGHEDTALHAKATKKWKETGCQISMDMIEATGADAGIRTAPG